MGRKDRDQGKDQDAVMGRRTDDSGKAAAAGTGGAGGHGRQLCPTCRGMGEVPKFFAGEDSDGGFTTNRLVCCGTCDGAGSVPGRTR